MSHTVTVKIYDLGVTELADISAICLERSFTRVLGGARSFTVTCPSANSLLTTVAADGYPNLRKGNRKLVVWEDGDPSVDDPIFHGRIFITEHTGDGTRNRVQITAYDPRMELGYEADDRAGRVVRGATVAGGSYDGNFILPRFVSSVDGGPLISGPDLIQQILKNSQNTGSESDPTPGEGPLPIDVISGAWDLDVPPAIDVSPVDSADWPVMVGDFINQLVATDVVDFDLRPIRPGAGLDVNGDASDYIMVEATSKSKLGTDRTATVHFDYWTGDHNAQACRYVDDFATVCNKLYDYLGPRLDNSHWRGNITPGTAGVTVDPTASEALYGGPPGALEVGRMFSIRVYDSLGTENSSRPLYLALFNAELGLRVEPRKQLYITPNMDAKALFVPPQDYDAYDLVQIKTGAEFGVELDEAQRVYGYTKTWSREGVATISELVTAADA